MNIKVSMSLVRAMASLEKTLLSEVYATEQSGIDTQAMPFHTL
jgi:histidinol phosphatase-like enzyme